MADTITTSSIGKGIATTDWVLLEETPTTALIFEPQVHQESDRGWLIRFKKRWPRVGV